MTLAPVSTLPLSEQVFRQLLDGLLDGSIVGVLPSERELAATFNVNRHAIREAIKRLQQANLVEVNQGGATRVLPVAEHARLDLMPELLVHGGTVDLTMVRDVLQMRLSVGTDAVRLCAERSPEVGATLLEHLPTEQTPDADLDPQNRAYWIKIVDGAQNLAYRLALNTLISGIDAVAGTPGGDTLVAVLHAEYRNRDLMSRIAAAITKGDGRSAARAADALLGPVVAALVSPDVAVTPRGPARRSAGAPTPRAGS